MVNADLEHRFNYHRPDEDAKERHQHVREILKQVAHDFTFFLPTGREQALALTKLEEAMFWANAAIARQGEVE